MTARPQALDRRFTADVVVPVAEYRDQVIDFARSVRRFVDQSPPKAFKDPFDQKQYDDFWSEYSDILRRYAAA